MSSPARPASVSGPAASETAHDGRWRVPVLLFLAALAVRLAFLLLEPPTRLVADEPVWLAAARGIAAAGFDPRRVDLIFYPPLHPYLVAIAWQLAGSLAGVKLVQALLGALLVPAVLAVGERAFDRRVGLLAAAAAAFYPELVWQSVHFWSEPLFMALLWGALAALLAAGATQRDGSAALAGLALGLAALTRDPALYFVPLAALWLVAAARRGWRLALILLVAATVVVLPWTLRNRARYGAPIPVSLMGARTFWEASARQHAEVIEAYAEVERAEGPLAAYRHAWREGLASLRARQPWWLFEQIGEQLPRFWTASNMIIMHLERRAYGQVPVWAARGVLLLTVLPHVLVTSVFLLGLAAMPGSPPRALLLLFLAFDQTIHVLTVGHPRFRLPVLPLVFLFAAAALVDWRRGRLRWTPARRVLALLLLLAFGLCLVPDVPATIAEPVFGLS